MDALKIVRHPTSLAWDDDEEADVHSRSVGEPRAAVGVDIGDGLVLHYDEAGREVAGLTVIGLRDRVRRGLEGAGLDGAETPRAEEIP